MIGSNRIACDPTKNESILRWSGFALTGVSTLNDVLRRGSPLHLGEVGFAENIFRGRTLAINAAVWNASNPMTRFRSDVPFNATANTVRLRQHGFC